MQRRATTAERDRAVLDWLERRPEQYKTRILDRLAVPLRPGGCREWTLSVQSGGYGHVGLPGTALMVLVHRVVYLHEHGDVPAGAQIGHTCRNRRCAEPTHLRAVTPGGDVRAGLNYMKTHCPAGHALTDDNLSPAHLKRGGRVCLECQRQRERSRDVAVREARLLLGMSARAYMAQYGRGEATARRIIAGSSPC